MISGSNEGATSGALRTTLGFRCLFNAQFHNVIRLGVIPHSSSQMVRHSGHSTKRTCFGQWRFRNDLFKNEYLFLNI